MEMKKKPERFDNHKMVQHDRYGDDSILLCNNGGGMSIQSKTCIYVFQNGPVTGVRYPGEILDPIVRLYAGAIVPDCILLKIMQSLTMPG